MVRVPLLVAATLALGAHPADAQRVTLDSLPAGSRVRVSAPPQGRTTGTVLAYRGDTLLLGRNGPAVDTASVALRDVRTLEVSLGKRRRIGRSLLRGAGWGIAVGTILGVVSASTSDGYYSDFDIPAGIVFGLTVGTVTGTVVGAFPRERWQSVVPRRGASLRVIPPSGRAGVRLGGAVPL